MKSNKSRGSGRPAWRYDNIALTAATAIYPAWLGYRAAGITWAIVAGVIAGFIWAAMTRTLTRHLPLSIHIALSVVTMVVVALAGYGIGRAFA